MPNFLVEEMTVRECGETGAIYTGQYPFQDLLLTLEVTHVKQQQDLDVDIMASEDGENWSSRPVASFLQKTYCGSYRAVVPAVRAQFLKAVWRVNRWGRKSGNPVVRFCLRVEGIRAARAMAGAA